MIRVVDCHAGVLGSNPGGPRYFPLGITSRLYVHMHSLTDLRNDNKKLSNNEMITYKCEI